MEIASVPFEFGFLKNVIYINNKELQGLAMSRSFGDNISKKIGVIHEP